MPSNPELSLRIRGLLLILLLVTAGLSIPTYETSSFVNSKYQDAPNLFFNLVFDLLQRPRLLQIIFSNPEASVNMLNYFQSPANANDSYFWLQYKETLFILLSDSDTYNILGNHPWLFLLMRTANQTNPALFNLMLQNRVNLNKLLNQTANHPEIAYILAPHPEYISRLYNLSSNLPTTGPWTRILFPLNGASISNSTQVVILTIADKNITQVTLTLLSSSLDTIGTFNATAAFFVNFTLDTTLLTPGFYFISVQVQLSDSAVTSDMIRLTRPR